MATVGRSAGMVALCPTSDSEGVPLLDSDGVPMLDSDGNYILDGEFVSILFGGKSAALEAGAFILGTSVVGLGAAGEDGQNYIPLNVRDVIKRAGRLHGCWSTGEDPTAEEMSDAVESINSMVRAMFGTIIGPRLSPQDLIGQLGAVAMNGGDYMIPATVFSLTAPLNPKSGSRFGVSDANLNFATNSLTVVRNGRLLEGAASDLTLNTNGDNRRWFFRGDTGDWERERDFATPDDTIYFPDSLIAYMPYMLAIVIAAEYGAEIRPDVALGNQEGRAVFARTYARRGLNQIDAPISMTAAQQTA